MLPPARARARSLPLLLLLLLLLVYAFAPSPHLHGAVCATLDLVRCSGVGGGCVVRGDVTDGDCEGETYRRLERV